MTVSFFYLLILLGSFTLALVTGLIRRILYPSELCDHVVVPSHEHWGTLQTPLADLVISFAAAFGLVTFLVHGFTAVHPVTVIGIGIVAGALGAVTVRLWFRHACEPSRQAIESSTARVVREIPATGFGQVEVNLGGTPVKLAAKSESGEAIPEGTEVEILDRRESVVVVRRVG